VVTIILPDLALFFYTHHFCDRLGQSCPRHTILSTAAPDLLLRFSEAGCLLPEKLPVPHAWSAEGMGGMKSDSCNILHNIYYHLITRRWLSHIMKSEAHIIY